MELHSTARAAKPSFTKTNSRPVLHFGNELIQENTEISSSSKVFDFPEANLNLSKRLTITERTTAARGQLRCVSALSSSSSLI
jgi:hypothetical protein